MSNPYPQYQLRTEMDTPNGYPSLDISGRILAIALPTITQKKDEKGQINGYAPLDSIGVVPLVHLPAVLVDSTELADAISAHEAAADPHTGYQRESEKGIAAGYASLDFSGVVPVAQLPAAIFAFGSIVVAGQSSIVSDTVGDGLTIVAGSNIVLTTNAATDTLTIASTASGGGNSYYPSGW